VVLDVCPSSNLRTGAVASWAEHPLRQLYDAGVMVTINSDDPTFFNTTITEEYRRAVVHFGFGADELVTMVRTAAGSAFLPPPQRAALCARIDAEIAALRRELNV
jgi:adenosine deaminase